MFETLFFFHQTIFSTVSTKDTVFYMSFWQIVFQIVLYCFVNYVCRFLLIYASLKWVLVLKWICNFSRICFRWGEPTQNGSNKNTCPKQYMSKLVCPNMKCPFLTPKWLRWREKRSPHFQTYWNKKKTFFATIAMDSFWARQASTSKQNSSLIYLHVAGQPHFKPKNASCQI